MEIVLATSNEHKVREINDIVTSMNLSLTFVLPPKDFDPEENGTNFEENSYIKAYEAWKLTKTWVLADDSGLCIDSLDGKPGIYSARYAQTPAKRIDRVLSEMSNKENRKGHFACAMTLINPEGKVEYAYKGVCEGKIIEKSLGTNGFGYDPIFVPDGYSQTIAELSEEEKNKISHRSKALTKVLEYISSSILR